MPCGSGFYHLAVSECATQRSVKPLGPGHLHHKTVLVKKVQTDTSRMLYADGREGSMHTRKVGHDRTIKSTYKFTPQDKELIAALAEQLRISQTAVVERAVRELAARVRYSTPTSEAASDVPG
jgi:hypothetical protein